MRNVTPRVEVTECKQTAARGTRARVTATHASVGGAPHGVPQQSTVRLPDITRGSTRQATGSKPTSVPSLPPISEASGSDRFPDEGFHDDEDEPRYEKYKMSGRVEQGKMFHPGKKMLYNICMYRPTLLKTLYVFISWR